MIEFDWLIHYTCNYRCPYCFFDAHWEKVKERNAYLPNAQWVEAWKKIHERYGQFRLTITGGEPFEYPDFTGLAQELQRFAFLSFDTNFSLGEGLLQKFAEALDPKKVFMGISYHPAFADRDAFIAKANFLKKRGFDFRVHYVTWPPQIGELAAVQRMFEGQGLRFTIIPFRGVFEGKSYPLAFSGEEKRRMHDAAADFVNTGDSRWAQRQIVQVQSKGKTCNAGRLYARVDADGTVYPCGQDFTRSGGSLVLGSIFDRDFALRAKPMECRQETCPCEFRWLVE